MFPTFTIDESRAYPRYVAWFCRLPQIWATLKAGAAGMGDRRRTLRPQQVLSLEMPLPPLEVQRCIVAQLDGIAQRIEAVRAIAERISDEITALIVSSNASWADGVLTLLGEALELTEDRVPVIPGEEYPQIGIRGFGGGLFAKPSIRTEDTTYRHFNRLHEDQFVLSQVKGWEGAVAVCSAEHAGFFASPEYRTFSFRRDRLRPSYFAYLCQTPWFYRYLSGPLLSGYKSHSLSWLRSPES
jgi:type I restriction enzyme S subunit